MLNESDDIICTSQSSITEDLELLCKIPKLTQASSESSLEIPPTIPPEIPTSFTCSVVDLELTTAQKKLRSEVEILPAHYEEVQYVNLDKSGEEILNLSRQAMSIFDCDILRHAISKMFKCKHCKYSNLRFYKSTLTAGIVVHIYIICEGCHSGTDFYNSTQTQSVKKHFANNILQLLGRRIISIIGVGKSAAVFTKNLRSILVLKS